MKPTKTLSSKLVEAVTGWASGTYHVGEARKIRPEAGITHECTVSRSAQEYAVFWWDCEAGCWTYGYSSKAKKKKQPPVIDREYTVTFSREVAWENHRSATCQVFATSLASAIKMGEETLEGDALIDVDHSDVRVIGVQEVLDPKTRSWEITYSKPIQVTEDPKDKDETTWIGAPSLEAAFMSARTLLEGNPGVEIVSVTEVGAS